jgi:hypothetical protein
MDVIADCLGQRPPLGSLPKKGPRGIRKAIGLAIAAAEQIDQDVDRKLFQWMLHSLRSRHIRLAGVSHEEVSRHAQATRGRSDYVAKIAEAVVIGVGRDRRVELQAVNRQ